MRPLTLTSGILLVVAAILSTAAPVQAQPGADHYHPLSQHTPPGKTAAWLNYIRKYDPSWLQPLIVEAPGGGRVDVFSGSNVAVGAAESPAKFAANVGHLYRLRLSDMPAYPGVEVFPTIELIDRLHPPQGRENDFPIPIVITTQDIKVALSGELMTRVVYLEQPQIAQISDPLRREIPQTVTPSENALKEADRLGRPMAIIRIGGRTPTAGSPRSFFGTGGAVKLHQPAFDNTEDAPAAVRLRNMRKADISPAGHRPEPGKHIIW